MVLHEIVSNSLGTVPVNITYCPLTATAIGFKFGATRLGTFGQFPSSNVVIYDRVSYTGRSGWNWQSLPWEWAHI